MRAPRAAGAGSAAAVTHWGNTPGQKRLPWPPSGGGASRFVCGHDVGKFTVACVEAGFEGKRPETVTLNKHASLPGARNCQSKPGRGEPCAQAAGRRWLASQHVGRKHEISLMPLPGNCASQAGAPWKRWSARVLFYLGFEPSTPRLPSPVFTERLCSSQSHFTFVTKGQQS